MRMTPVTQGCPCSPVSVVIFQARDDDDFSLPPHRDEELDRLLSDQDSNGEGGLSIAEALLPLVDSLLPPLIPWVYSTRYKTELCTSYATSGFCRYAERCQFAHGLHELHVPFRHPKYKTELCRSYHTAGYCYYGPRCLFVHSPLEQRPACRRRRRRNVPCRTFRSYGVCPFGTRCNFLHVEGGDGDCGTEPPDSGEKTQLVSGPPLHQQAKAWKPRGALCHTFSSFGFCLYGTRCRFQHGLLSTLRQGSNPGQEVSPSPRPISRALSQSSDMFSSTSTSPPQSTSASPLTTPPVQPTVHNAFTFSTPHLSDLLLPVALQQLEGGQGGRGISETAERWG
ncbi:cysteine three histidine 1 [Lampris incognitus]|uniref:cysteine three histidine 1 n=1 Tax=Lampris incognitus TaxID=2546036 RepID=UPI0024B53433|nr:cysteine three histidine 1 [Lampris incognitus]